MSTMAQALKKIITQSIRYRHKAVAQKHNCHCNYSNNYYNDQVCISAELSASQ